MPAELARWLYTLLLYTVGLGVVLPLRLYRRPGAVKQLGRSLGWVNISAAQRGGVCVHAVSLGEAVAARPLVQALLQSADGQLPLVLTATTLTGLRAQAQSLGDRDGLEPTVFPLDLPGAVGRFLSRVQPRLLILMETEIWPNLIHQCHKRGIEVLLLNARLSERSAQRYRLFKPLVAATLAKLGGVAAQTAADGQRFVELGLPEAKLSITGNLKFDQSLGDQQRQRAKVLRRDWGERPVWIAGSTHKWEEVLVIRAARILWARFPDMLLVLVPRHPERFSGVATLCRRLGEKPVLYSDGQPPEAADRVLLVDAMGELPSLYGAADVAFVGGSLREIGGHNMLEAAVWGVPVVTGPHTRNFTAVVDKLSAAGALRQLETVDADLLAAEVGNWLANPEDRRRAGEAGAQVVAENSGALAAQWDLVKRYSTEIGSL